MLGDITELACLPAKAHIWVENNPLSMSFLSPATAKMSEDAKVPLGSITNRLCKQRSESFKSRQLTETSNGTKTTTLPRKSTLLPPCTNCLGQDEYIKCLQCALLEVSEESEVLRERVVELEALLSQLEEDLQVRDTALLQLQCKSKARSKLVV